MLILEATPLLAAAQLDSAFELCLRLDTTRRGSVSAVANAVQKPHPRHLHHSHLSAEACSLLHHDLQVIHSVSCGLVLLHGSALALAAAVKGTIVTSRRASPGRCAKERLRAITTSAPSTHKHAAEKRGLMESW